MSRQGAIQWEVHPPPGEGRAADWLGELSEMRGRVLYDGGRRPSFRRPDGTFEDCDARDVSAYHLIARAQERSIGCIRLLPLDAAATCLTEEIVGEKLFSRALDRLRVPRRQAAECGRWIVASEYRHCFLGMRLAAGIIAVGRRLGYRMLIGPTGVRDGQVSLLRQIGARPLPCLSRLEAPHYDDELDVLYLFPSRVESSFASVIDDMTIRLNVERLCSGEPQTVTAYEAHASA